MVSTEAIKQGNVLEGIGLGGINFSSFGTVFLIGFIVLLIIGGICGVVIWWYLRKAFNQKVWIFGRVGNVPMLKEIDSARYVKFGSAGDRLFQIRRRKKFQPPPTIQMGKNLWWFWEREDGELINVGLEDIDEKMRNVGAYFVDTDMRMQRLGIEKNLRERMEEKGFLAKYGTTIAMGIFVVLITIALVVLFTQLRGTAQAIDNMAGKVGTVAENIDKLYTKRIGGESPNDVEGGSGLVEVDGS